MKWVQSTLKIPILASIAPKVKKSGMIRSLTRPSVIRPTVSLGNQTSLLARNSRLKQVM